MSTRPRHLYTPDEYLALDREAEVKSEYLGGEVFAMGGASSRHVAIVSNLVRELGNQLRERPCIVYSSDLRVQVGDAGMFAYPDVVVVCGRSEFRDDRRDTLVNPLLIVEVLSSSTKNYDRGEKFEQYRRIPTFLEYLLVAQDTVHIEHFTKQGDGTWLLAETDDAGATIELGSIGCRLAAAEIYAKLDQLAGDGACGVTEPAPRPPSRS